MKTYYANLANRNFTVTGNAFIDRQEYGLTPGLKYYKVVPVDDYNNRATSNEATATPSFALVILESRVGANAGPAPAPAYSESGILQRHDI